MPWINAAYESGVREIAEGLEPPYEDFPEGECPPVYVGSRESLEAILRRSVRQPKYGVQWLSGTVTGLHLSDTKTNELKSVTVRLEKDGGSEIRTIDATLVLGLLPMLTTLAILNSNQIALEIAKPVRNGCQKCCPKAIKQLLCAEWSINQG